jgi:hypothetical protein
VVLELDNHRVAIESPVSYLLSVLAAVVVVRVLVGLFKAFAYGDGEHNSERKEKETDPLAGYGFWRRFAVALSGFHGDRTTRDYWLPGLIGFAELCAFPALIAMGMLEVVGSWLLLKTAGQWSAWGKSRTSFNRFLFGNLLVLAFSYFWLRTFVADVG